MSADTPRRGSQDAPAPAPAPKVSPLEAALTLLDHALARQKSGQSVQIGFTEEVRDMIREYLATRAKAVTTEEARAFHTARAKIERLLRGETLPGEPVQSA